MDSCNFKSSLSLRASTCLLLLAISMLAAAPTSGRVLDEVTPPVAPAAPAEPAPVETTPAPLDTPDAATSPPLALVTPAGPPTTSAEAAPTAGGAAAADHNTLTFFMHDIVGGYNPSAPLVTGVATNAGDDGQLPLAKPNVGVGVPISAVGNGDINNNNNNNNNNKIPLLTGLGGNIPAGASLQKLVLLGTMGVMDEELREGEEMGSGVVGKAQGFYIASSLDETSQTMAFTAMFNEGDYADSLSFFGVRRTAGSGSHVAVVGGTGKYANAKGFATLQALPPVDEMTHGVQTLLQVQVKLVY